MMFHDKIIPDIIDLAMIKYGKNGQSMPELWACGTKAGEFLEKGHPIFFWSMSP
jgi:hypothetical protein